MEKTITEFKAQQAQSVHLLTQLSDFLQQARSVGVKVDVALQAKLENALQAVSDKKLKVALIGGFSEGKTTIAAAWMEKLDKSSMNISQQESSNQVKIYTVGDDIELIDTPGLFGFKEQVNAETNEIEKYKDITKKYVSEAHLVLYVMNSTNPIKESHREDLEWLFKTLNLLPRTVFVLSRFDEVADVEDEKEFNKAFDVKKQNVVSRLTDILGLDSASKACLSVVAVAANPFDMGIEHWLSNMETFRLLSHIDSLQTATAEKIKNNGGLESIANETKRTIIRDILTKQLPVAIETNRQLEAEVSRLHEVNDRFKHQLGSINSNLSAVKIHLRDFVANYFSDLILQTKKLSLETFGDFYERELGQNGVMVNARINSEFERQANSVSMDLRKMQVTLVSEIDHFNETLMTLGKNGLSKVVAGSVINNKSILATRDGIVTLTSALGLDIGKYLKFKPWGAHNLAGKLNAGLAALGLALELWDSYTRMQKQKELDTAINEMVSNFNQQREELINLINSQEFVHQIFPEYRQIIDTIDEVNQNLQEKAAYQRSFENWLKQGEIIDAEFSVIA